MGQPRPPRRKFLSVIIRKLAEKGAGLEDFQIGQHIQQLGQWVLEQPGGAQPEARQHSRRNPAVRVRFGKSRSNSATISVASGMVIWRTSVIEYRRGGGRWQTGSNPRLPGETRLKPVEAAPLTH